jgi:hypothetical protein
MAITPKSGFAARPGARPGIAGAVGNGGGNRRSALHIRDRRTHVLRHRIVVGLVVAAAAGGGSEHHYLALHQLGEMLLDRIIDAGCRCDPGEPPREGVQVAHLVFPLLGEIGLLFHRVGQMARDQRDDHEQREIEDLERPRDEVGASKGEY